MPAASCIIFVVSQIVLFSFFFFWFCYSKFTKNVLNICVIWSILMLWLFFCNLIVIVASVWWMEEKYVRKLSKFRWDIDWTDRLLMATDLLTELSQRMHAIQWYWLENRICIVPFLVYWNARGHVSLYLLTENANLFCLECEMNQAYNV